MTEDNSKTQEVTLDVLRDSKCIPVAEAIISEMESGLLPDEVNGNIDLGPLGKKFIGILLEADVNLTTEVPYVPQLILGVLSGLNASAQLCDTVPLDEVRYNAISKKILSSITGAGLVKPSRKSDAIGEDFKDVRVKLQEIFTEENLNIMEVKYVMDKIFDGFRALTTMVQNSLDSSTAKAEAKLFGVESMEDLTLGQLDKVLTTPKE